MNVRRIFEPNLIRRARARLGGCSFTACPALAGARCVVAPLGAGRLAWPLRLLSGLVARAAALVVPTLAALQARETRGSQGQEVFNILPSSPRPRWSLPNQSFLILPGNSGLAAGGGVRKNEIEKSKTSFCAKGTGG